MPNGGTTFAQWVEQASREDAWAREAFAQSYDGMLCILVILTFAAGLTIGYLIGRRILGR